MKTEKNLMEESNSQGPSWEAELAVLKSIENQPRYTTVICHMVSQKLKPSTAKKVITHLRNNGLIEEFEKRGKNSDSVWSITETGQEALNRYQVIEGGNQRLKQLLSMVEGTLFPEWIIKSVDGRWYHIHNNAAILPAIEDENYDTVAYVETYNSSDKSYVISSGMSIQIGTRIRVNSDFLSIIDDYEHYRHEMRKDTEELDLAKQKIVRLTKQIEQLKSSYNKMKEELREENNKLRKEIEAERRAFDFASKQNEKLKMYITELEEKLEE